MRLEAALGEILLKAGELPWEHHLYVPREEQLTLTTLVIVLNDDEEPEAINTNEPEYAESKNMKYLLGFSAVQDVVENLQQQIQSP